MKKVKGPANPLLRTKGHDDTGRIGRSVMGYGKFVMKNGLMTRLILSRPRCRATPRKCGRKHKAGNELDMRLTVNYIDLHFWLDTYLTNIYISRALRLIEGARGSNFGVLADVRQISSIHSPELGGFVGAIE